MKINITVALVELTYDAVLKTFWRRNKLRLFLVNCGVAKNYLATIPADESKRDILDKVFADLTTHPKGNRAIAKMAVEAAEMKTFPDLDGWEDTEKMLRDARNNTDKLRRYLTAEREKASEENGRRKARKAYQEKQIQINRSKTDLSKLDDRLKELSQSLGTQRAGYDFQNWFYDLMEYSEVVSRRPYMASGRQIDGSVTVDNTTYLVELKFTSDQAVPTDIDSLKAKVYDKADNTMGILLSVSGFTRTAITEASGPRSTLLLMDFKHLYAVLTGTYRFSDVVDRITDAIRRKKVNHTLLLRTLGKLPDPTGHNAQPDNNDRGPSDGSSGRSKQGQNRHNKGQPQTGGYFLKRNNVEGITEQNDGRRKRSEIDDPYSFRSTFWDGDLTGYRHNPEGTVQYPALLHPPLSV